MALQQLGLDKGGGLTLIPTGIAAKQQQPAGRRRAGGGGARPKRTDAGLSKESGHSLEQLRARCAPEKEYQFVDQDHVTTVQFGTYCLDCKQAGKLFWQCFWRTWYTTNGVGKSNWCNAHLHWKNEHKAEVATAKKAHLEAKEAQQLVARRSTASLYAGVYRLIARMSVEELRVFLG